jgi:plastocyanin
MSALDSRFLTYLDCFGQRFSAVGRVHYAVTSPTAACLTLDDKPFVIEVGEKRDGEPQQHNVEVQYRGGAFTVTPNHLTIAAGDVVVWHASLATTPPFAVWGDLEDGPFSSMALRQAAFYSHAFGAAGEFRWRDANNGGVEGVVRVREIDPNDREACDRWRKELQAGAVVAIEGDRVDPRDVEIVAGQTVFFAVTGSRGLTITEDILAVPVVIDHHMTGSRD